MSYSKYQNSERLEMSKVEIPKDTISTQNRSVTFDVFLGDEQKEKYREIIASIRAYRAIARQVYSGFAILQAAGAEVLEVIGKDRLPDIRVKPNFEKARLLSEQLFEKVGKRPLYEMRDWINAIAPQMVDEKAPDGSTKLRWLAFVGDGLRDFVFQRWKAGDPEFPKASRGWLTLQGSRGLGQFNNAAISFPQLTARPKFEGHVITLKWDHQIGPIDFKLPSLDGGRYVIWRAVREGEWSPGTVLLSERDGQLRVTISYKRPTEDKKLSPARVMEVRFSDEIESLIRLVGPDGAASYFPISAAEVAGWLRAKLKQRQVYEARKESTGAGHQPWGHKKARKSIQEKISHLTTARLNGAKTWNHLWSKRIVTTAAKWDCGVIKVVDLPSRLMARDENLPWDWSGLNTSIKYKAEFNKIQFEEFTTPKEKGDEK